ncbi:MAG: hypothetical protein ABIF87_09465 [Pseudomonadota bacterium]
MQQDDFKNKKAHKDGVEVAESHPNIDTNDPRSPGLLSFLRKDKENSISRNNIFPPRKKKIGTENAGLWGTISKNLYNRLEAFGIIDSSGMEVKFDFEFNLPIKNQDVPMLIQIKKRAESELTETVDIEMLQRQVADVIGNSKIKRFVAELDNEGNIHPIYFVDFKDKVVSL